MLTLDTHIQLVLIFKLIKTFKKYKLLMKNSITHEPIMVIPTTHEPPTIESTTINSNLIHYSNICMQKRVASSKWKY